MFVYDVADIQEDGCTWVLNAIGSVVIIDPFPTYVTAAVAESQCLKAHNGVRDKAGAPPRQSFTHRLFLVVNNEVPKPYWDSFLNVLNVICDRHIVKPTWTRGEERSS